MPEYRKPPTVETSRVTYVGPLRPGVKIAATGMFAPYGQPVEVPADLAESLCLQSIWEATNEPAPPAEPDDEETET